MRIIRFGQSYLYLEDGRWHEARASFFGGLEGLHFTPGRALADPHSLPEAMSRIVPTDEVVGCFRCHGTGVSSEHSVDATRIVPGVSCEACHGPGGPHVTAATAEKLTSGAATGESGALMLDPRRLSPIDAVDFCGACHSTSWDVRMSGKTGKATLPFPV
jgi:Cytochrome c554 and c-prime